MLILCLELQLKILRYMVELQLVHSADIKAVIDRAWGITQNKEKRKGAANAPGLPDASDPLSQDNIILQPIGQDASRKRYWVTDGQCVVLFCFVWASPDTLCHLSSVAPPGFCTSHALFPHMLCPHRLVSDLDQLKPLEDFGQLPLHIIDSR